MKSIISVYFGLVTALYKHFLVKKHKNLTFLYNPLHHFVWLDFISTLFLHSISVYLNTYISQRLTDQGLICKTCVFAIFFIAWRFFKWWIHCSRKFFLLRCMLYVTCSFPWVKLCASSRAENINFSKELMHTYLKVLLDVAVIGSLYKC